MNRRQFVKTAALAASGVTLGTLNALTAYGEDAGETGWRNFQVDVSIDIFGASGPVRAWLPLPLEPDTDYHRTLGSSWRGNADAVQVVRDPRYDAGILFAEWNNASEAPKLEVGMRFSTRDRVVDISQTRALTPLPAKELELYTAPTKLLPTDGIVLDTARAALRNARGDDELAKARAIYDWVVDNTFRDPKTQGCGRGDIKAMLETGNLGGKCADINALFVGLCRAAGIAARDIYGVRVAEARWGFKSLGKSGDVSKAQHCRAEFYSPRHGWVPVDPGDVRKVVLEEKPGLTLNDGIVREARARLFGAWEMNWLAYNYAHDLALPKSTREAVAFLMYPQAETSDGPRESLKPDAFRYQISAREISA